MQQPLIAVVLGTRPEIIKLFPVIAELKRRKRKFIVIHTGQHYSVRMDRIFFADLKIQEPDILLGVGPGKQGEQTAKMLRRIEKALLDRKPDIILVEGDTNSVLAAALAAAKLGIRIGHIEAGLRSYCREMPEEINRILTDHLSDFLFAPTKTAMNNLVAEGVEKRKIFVTGNTIVDVTKKYAKKAAKDSRILQNMELTANNYLLLTLHRKENVDNAKKLKEIFQAIKILSGEFPVVFPIHPRTAKRIRQYRLARLMKKIPNLKIIQPQGYFDFLNLQQHARLILTDSGGIQEEACILKVPCVTLRENTERPETLDIGSNMIAGWQQGSILRATRTMLKKRRSWKQPFGNGTSGKKIVDIVTKAL
jgi:UDP-N-acetylglucosamine 2-epimerase (non-hydrolysing)